MRTLRLVRTGCAVIAILAIALVFSKTSAHAQTSFFGVSLGMPAPAALEALGRPKNALDRLPYITGKKILNDTIPVTSCGLLMRRSVGFDSSAQLCAIGVTYKTNPEFVEKARTCTLEWLTNTYGDPSREQSDPGIVKYWWNLGTTVLTLESKRYNDRDYFVLVYFYRSQNQ